MTYETLITTARLAALVDDPSVVVVDCRFRLDDPTWGRQSFDAGHIPGAAYAHLDSDLSGTKSGRNGRHPLPDPHDLTRTIGALGIANQSQVIAYDQDNGMYASRLWWLLRWMGHDAVAVLDGGFAKWTAEGRPLRSEEPMRRPRVFSGAPRAEAVCEADEVATLARDGRWRVLDARAPERFRGDVEPIDKVAGHIPGARNHPFPSNLADDGTFRDPAELRWLYAKSIAGVKGDHIVCYCGSGVTACHNLLALEHAGIHGARLYPGSWSEWSSDPARPVARG